jgi:hypothetical protein
MASNVENMKIDCVPRLISTESYSRYDCLVPQLLQNCELGGNFSSQLMQKLVPMPLRVIRAVPFFLAPDLLNTTKVRIIPSTMIKMDAKPRLR